MMGCVHATFACTQPIGLLFWGSSSSYNEYLNSIAFSLDGKVLAYSSSNASNGFNGYAKTYLLNLDPQSWIESVCENAGRNFTHTEWEQYFRGEKYRITCPQWNADVEQSIATAIPFNLWTPEIFLTPTISKTPTMTPTQIYTTPPNFYNPMEMIEWFANRRRQRWHKRINH